MQATSSARLERSASTRLDRIGKRIFDIMISSLALVLLSPVFGVIALAITLDDRGPVFFRQERVGYRGRRFRMTKFRSMAVGADSSVHVALVKRFAAGTRSASGFTDHRSNAWKPRDDARITRVGRFLRRTSLDELPQLWDVLAGNMSLVGPRPAISYEVEMYPEYYLPRLEAVPGITGLWQVEARGKADLAEMVRLDLEYIQRRSFWYDLVLIARTFPVVLGGKGNA